MTAGKAASPGQDPLARRRSPGGHGLTDLLRTGLDSATEPRKKSSKTWAQQLVENLIRLAIGGGPIKKSGPGWRASREAVIRRPEPPLKWTMNSPS